MLKKIKYNINPKLVYKSLLKKNIHYKNTSKVNIVDTGNTIYIYTGLNFQKKTTTILHNNTKKVNLIFKKKFRAK